MRVNTYATEGDISMARGENICAFIEAFCLILQGAKVGQPITLMKFQRKKETEARQCQIAATIRYISCGLIAALSIGDFALL
jgi:hypothetical protein